MTKHYPLTVLALFTALTIGQSASAANDINNEDEMLSMLFNEDELVETATRSPKPISQVAENVTIITAAEIERMNAHNVDDVLNRVTGVYVGYHGKDFNHTSYLSIHGSNYKHVIVLLDGIKYSKATDDIAWVNSIPVNIIKRIEVIRGAASSTWGSALGGVINIITKDSGTTSMPVGNVTASKGEFGSYYYHGDLAGKAGQIGYFVAGGHLESDGLRDDKYFDSDNFYSKFNLALPGKQNLQFTMGYSEPDYQSSYFPDYDFKTHINDRNLFFTGSFDTMLSDQLNLHLSLHRFDNDYTSKNNLISSDTTYKHFAEDQSTIGASARLDWQLATQQLVVGLDYVKNELDLVNEMTNYQAPKIYEENWAVFANNTINFGNLHLIPGLRFDQLSNSEDQISPSVGVTYMLNASTMFRASAAKGFRKPPITYLEDSLPTRYYTSDLDPEEVWSYQAGIETNALPFCRLKTTLFSHDANESFQWDSSIMGYINKGHEDRDGLELELTTDTFYDTRFVANYTYVHLKNENNDNNYQHVINVIVTYDNPRFCTAELSGHYVDYGDLYSPSYYEGIDSNMVWDLSINRQLSLSDRIASELFFVAHNLTDEDQYKDYLLKNNPRWIEVGLKIHF